MVVGRGRGVVVDALESDYVQRPVELAITAAVEAVAVLLAAGRVDRRRACQRGEGRLGRHPVWISAGDNELRRADRADAAFCEQLWCDLGHQCGEAAVDLGDLLGQALDPPTDSPQHVGDQIRARAKLGCFSGELLFGQRRQLVAERFRRGHHEATELVHRSLTRPHSAATLDQQKPQLLPLATAVRDTQPLTGDDAACCQGGMDQVVLAAATLATARRLALVHPYAFGLEESHQASAIAAAALHTEYRPAKCRRPRRQALIARQCRFRFATVQLSPDPTQRDRDMRFLVGIHSDCHRLVGHVASLSSIWSTGLDRALSGKARKLLSGHRPVDAKRRRETGRFQGKTNCQHG